MSTMGAIWRQLLGIAISGVSIFWADCTQAQSKIIPDNTLGAERSNVIPNYGGLPVEVINGGATRGQNLFHSFLEFNVSQGRGAYFYSPSAAIQNIVTRVTGSNPSEILGVLGTVGNSTPNLFLINPNGIIFGPNASLNVSGSFVATTANAIQFGNIGIFSATTPDAPSPLLTINPTALFYNQIAAGVSIQNSSQATAVNGFVVGLQVPDGKSLLLVGGDIDMDGGRLRANGGRVELAGLAAPGTIGLNVVGDTLSLSVPDDVQRSDVSLSNQANVSVIGAGGGDIAINARNFNITGSSLGGGVASSSATISTRAGNININAADTVTIDGSSSMSSSSAIVNGVIGNGSAGDILIKTGSLNIIGNALIGSTNNGQGNTANITIQATDAVSVSGTNSGVFSALGSSGLGNGGDVSIQARSLSLSDGALVSTSTLGRGNAGNVQINTDQLSLTNGARLMAATYGQGNAGNVMINASRSVSVDGNETNISSTVGDVGSAQNNLAIGKGGNIQITTDQLSLTHGAQLDASTFGQGNAGNVTINARKGVSFDGTYTNSNGEFVSSGILTTVGDVSSNQNNIVKGNGGNIQITTDQLSLTKGAQLQANTYGQGNAGNISINATKSVSFDGNNTGVSSGVGSANDAHNDVANGKGGTVDITTNQLQLSDGAVLNAITFGQGDAGNISININSLSLTSGAQLQATTLGQGNAGNVIINATKSVSLNGSGIFSSVGFVNYNQNNLIKGKGGNIQITTDQLSLTNGAQLVASNFGQGNAGNVIINATKNVSLDNSGIFSTVGAFNSAKNNLAIGKGGNIQITTDQLSLSGAQLDASTFGQGNAGNVIINATKNVSLDGHGAIFSTVGDVNSNQNDVAKGKGGNIQITTDQLSLTKGSQLLAKTYGQGNAGNISINATKSVSFDGNNTGVSSGVGSANDAHNDVANGKGGTVDITTNQLQLSDGAVLNAITFGQGDAGNISININSLSLTSGAQLQATTLGQGNAGNVIINATKSVSLNGSGIFSSVGFVNYNQNNLFKGKGGNIQITTDQLSLTSGSQLIASTYGQGNAGNVIINATKSISLDGNRTVFFSTAGDPGLSSQRNSIAQGKGGDINITTNELSLTNGAQLNSSTFGQSDAGNLEISADSIRLDHGLITSQTNSGNGGNITLTPKDLLLLRHGSQISTTAGIAQLGGNGGNITINAANGFIVAIPNEKSDITANAFSGTGGQIQINATSVFGLTVLSREDLIKLLGNNELTQLDFQRLPTSAITAVSQTNPTLNGTVVIDTANINPSQGLLQLSTNLINPNTLIANSCIARTKKQQGTFNITGTGGLPNHPGDAFMSSYPTGTVRNVRGNSISSSWHKGDPIVEPQGVYQLPNGHLVLSRECS